MSFVSWCCGREEEYWGSADAFDRGGQAGGRSSRVEGDGDDAAAPLGERDRLGELVRGVVAALRPDVRAEAAQGKTNQGTLCLKGYYGWDFINDTQILTPRLKTPMIRRELGGKLEAVSWSEALDYVATRLSAIKAKYGPDAIQTTGSSRGTGNETNYVMQKFARAVIGTNNVDCCARV